MTDDWQRLAPQARWLFHVQALIRFFLVQLPMSGGVGLMVGFWTSWVIGVAVGLTAGFIQLTAALWMPTLAYERYRYQLRKDDLLIESGVLIRRRTSVPYSRVQHVDTFQGVIEQSIGLARVHVYTAAGFGADGAIPGLTVEDAEALRDALVERGGGDDGL